MPRRHCGLGSGTQLAIGTAAALMAYFELPMLAAEELSAAIGRGKRSAIGTYGFFRGGLLVDRGRTRHESIAPLDFQTEFPEDWPIMLIMQRNAQGLFGTDELDAFRDLPDVSPAQRQAMSNLVRDRMIPGVLNRNFEEFCRSRVRIWPSKWLVFRNRPRRTLQRTRSGETWFTHCEDWDSKRSGRPRGDLAFLRSFVTMIRQSN